MDEILQAVSTLGFPIAMTLILVWYVNKMGDQHKEELDALRSTVEQNSKVIVENTTILSMIWQKIGADDNKDE